MVCLTLLTGVRPDPEATPVPTERETKPLDCPISDPTADPALATTFLSYPIKITKPGGYRAR